MCRAAVERIMRGQGEYDAELDRVCEEIGSSRAVVQPLFDRALSDARGETRRE
jgi:hypothetical protein